MVHFFSPNISVKMRLERSLQKVDLFNSDNNISLETTSDVLLQVWRSCLINIKSDEMSHIVVVAVLFTDEISQ